MEKSLLIKLFALFRAYHNKRTFICVPTIALLNEYKSDFQKLDKNNIRITSFDNINDAKIYILTQERMLNIEIEKDDVLIVDEFYEIIDNNLRSYILRSVINRFINNNCAVKMFQPSIVKINDSFKDVINNFNDITIIRNFNNPCCQVIKKIYNMSVSSCIEEILKKDINQNDKTAIYTIKSNQLKIAELISKNKPTVDDIENELWYKFLEDQYSSNYLPLLYLKNGIVVNNGDLPKLFRYVTEKLFKNKNIFKIIICNNTLSKGVNLSIKNLIVASKNGINENQSINKFELKNLFGRVGRISNDILDRNGNLFLCFSKKGTINNIENIVKSNSEINLDIIK